MRFNKREALPSERSKPGSAEHRENAINAHREAFSGDKPVISYAKITRIIKGHLPVRNIDVRKEYRVIKWEEQAPSS